MQVIGGSAASSPPTVIVTVECNHCRRVYQLGAGEQLPPRCPCCRSVEW